MKNSAFNIYQILILIIILPAVALGENSSMSGRVIGSDGEPLISASVSLAGTKIGAKTNSNGFYKINEIPSGSFKLKASYVGYVTHQEVLIIGSGKDLEKNITLQQDVLNLDDVVVSGTRYEYDRANAPVIVNVIDNKLLNATQSIAISEGLNYQPGVRVEANCQNCSFTQVRLNGLEGAYSQILINSRPIFSALNSVYGLDQIPTNIVEQIEVVRSGGSALYGSNAIGGTINIITKEPIENTWEVRSNTAMIDNDALDQTLNFNGSLVSEDLKSGVTFFGMSRNRDAYDANDDGFTELVGLNNNVLGGKTFLKPSENSKLSIDFSVLNEYRRGGDRLELAPHFTDITEELDHNTFFGGINYDIWSKDSEDKISIYSSAQSTSRESYYGGLGGGRTTEDSVLALSAYGRTKDLALITGAQYNRYFENDVFTFGTENQFYDTEDEIKGYNRVIDQQVNILGFFGQYEWKPNEKLTTLIGARYDISTVDGFYRVSNIERNSDVEIGVFSPRLTLMYKPNQNLRFRGGYARGFRAPQAFNEDLHISSVGGEPQFVILNDDLDKELSDAFTASINYSKEFGLIQTNFLLEGFYTQLQNPFTQVSTGSVLPNGSIIEEVRNGEGAVVSGFNFEAGFSPNEDFAFQFGGTLQQARYNESQVLFEPEGEPAGGERVVVIEDFVRTPNLYGYFTTFYNITNDLKIDVTGSYTGAMIVPRVVSQTGFIDLYDSDPFIDVNIKASCHFDINSDFHLELSGGFKNILNSFQSEFESGPQRDSDFVFGPLAPRSVFLSVKIGNLH